MEAYKPSWHSAARQIGVSVAEYAALRLNGEAWCTGCRKWYSATSKYFAPCRSRVSGLQSLCRECDRRRKRVKYRHNRALLNEPEPQTEPQTEPSSLPPVGELAVRVSWQKSIF